MAHIRSIDISAAKAERMCKQEESTMIDSRPSGLHNSTGSTPKRSIDNTPPQVADALLPKDGGEWGSQGTTDTSSSMQIDMQEIPTHAAALDPSWQVQIQSKMFKRGYGILDPKRRVLLCNRISNPTF